MNADRKRPNIIQIMVESWDGRVLGLYGDPALKNITPNLDRFAEKGVVFNHHYTTQPICCPARANFWSGQYTFNCKSWNNHKGLEKGTPILKDVLLKHGNYDVKHIGKSDYVSGGHSNQNRITAWTGAANIELPSYLQKEPKVHRFPRKKIHMRDWKWSRNAKKYIKNQIDRQKGGDIDPFFLYLSLITPHPRFKTTKKWLSKVDYDAVSIPPKDEELHPVIRFQQIQKAWTHGFSEKDVRKTRAIYYAMVAELDAVVGEVLDYLEEIGIFEDTYILITGDHGENNMEHELFYKMNMYESSVNTPLLISGPGIQKGMIIENHVQMTDLYPTILDMAGIDLSKAPNKLDGESLLPLCTGETEKSRNWAFSMHTGTAANTSMFMLRYKEWKYIAYPGFEPQLFNMEEDPDEIHNLASKKPDIIKMMDVKLREIVDYDAVHDEWQEYCKESFREYREQVRQHPIRLFEYGAAKVSATYEEVIANTYKGWTDEHARQLEEWLNSKN